MPFSQITHLYYLKSLSKVILQNPALVLAGAVLLTLLLLLTLPFSAAFKSAADTYLDTEQLTSTFYSQTTQPLLGMYLRGTL